MKNQMTYIGAGVVVLVLIIIYTFNRVDLSESKPAPVISTATSSMATTTLGTTTSVSLSTNTSSFDPKAVSAAAWTVFRAYVAAAKNHDIKTVASLSYQLSDACKDPAQMSACNTRMDSVYVSGTFMEASSSDYTNIVGDAKQIIMSTNWTYVETPDLAGYTRQIMYFTRKPDGTPQVLSFSPADTAYVQKVDANGKTLTQAQIISNLQTAIKDTDGDTLLDETENCAYPGVPTTCVKTDPTKKDTDGNGWWDSTQSFFYTS